MTNQSISSEVIAALRVIREQDRGPEFRDAMSVLDNAGTFAEIDAATECTCPPDERAKSGTDNHYIECPARPAAECPCPSGYDFINGGVGQCTCPKVHTTAQR